MRNLLIRLLWWRRVRLDDRERDAHVDEVTQRVDRMVDRMGKLAEEYQRAQQAIDRG